MQQTIKCYRELVKCLQQEGLVIGRSIGENVYEVLSIKGNRMRSGSLCVKVFTQVPYIKIHTEYTIARQCWEVDPTHFLRVWTPLFFTMPDRVFGVHLDCCAMLMERGQPLDLNPYPHPISQYLNLMREIGTALQTLHRQGILHFDLKPSHIVKRSNGHYCLIDFGISKRIGGGEINSLDLTGSKYYMSPDQFRGVLSYSCDLYSFGMTIRSLLLGGTERINGLFPNEILAEKMALQPLFSDDEHVQRFLSIVNRLTEFSARRRYRNIGEVLEAIEHFPTTPDIKLYADGQAEAG